jgi:hypothetical protein
MKSHNRRGGRLRGGLGYGSEKHVEEGGNRSHCDYCRYYGNFRNVPILATPRSRGKLRHEIAIAPGG